MSSVFEFVYGIMPVLTYYLCVKYYLLDNVSVWLVQAVSCSLTATAFYLRSNYLANIYCQEYECRERIRKEQQLKKKTNECRKEELSEKQDHEEEICLGNVEQSNVNNTEQNCVASKSLPPVESERMERWAERHTLRTVRRLSPVFPALMALVYTQCCIACVIVAIVYVIT